MVSMAYTASYVNGVNGSSSSAGPSSSPSHNYYQSIQKTPTVLKKSNQPNDDQRFRRIVKIASVSYVTGILAIYFLINEEVPKPYMDEIFHVDQARSYCIGNFTKVCMQLSVCMYDL